MRKIISLLIAFVLLISLVSCNMMNVIEFERDGIMYYYEYSEGVKTITNYHPYKIWKLPNYQEMVQLGDGVGLDNEGKVYFILVVDTSMDSNNPKSYYSVEIDAETKTILCTYGEYFSNDAEKNATVERLINLIDTVYFK